MEVMCKYDGSGGNHPHFADNAIGMRRATGHGTDIGTVDALDNDNVKLSVADIGINTGYDCNYALKRKWPFRLNKSAIY